ncbi:winged helix-turn-helix transcriptional regulator [Chryseobacterium sp. HR92]|uniref:winged helix-turn-helix transcriptional regulator n=1 Tax=Chryseobacterium sp. HR92 TaxID=3094839 RepID=UPI00388D9845|nr:helix-turn-helix domain-containing protein [Chryseobacterium sp. HR92]
MKKKEELSPECIKHIRGVKDTVDLLNGKWKTFIIDKLYYTGKIRFMDLKRQTEIAPKVLSKELKDLEMNNLVKRTENNNLLVSIEYELTDFGKSLHNVIDVMGKWGIDYREQLLKERIIKM